MYLFDKNGKLTNIDIHDVICIERRERVTMFRTGPDHYCDPATMKQLAAVYNRFGFHQIDRNQLINLHKVDRVQGNKYYIDNHPYVVSRRNELSIKDEFDNIR
jgi:DNA-binding LytR/AlgR family response regulator